MNCSNWITLSAAEIIPIRRNQLRVQNQQTIKTVRISMDVFTSFALRVIRNSCLYSITGHFTLFSVLHKIRSPSDLIIPSQ